MATCYSCGGEYSHLGQHWRLSECNYPELTEYQKEVLTGWLMGDACISKSSRQKPRFVSAMVNKEYLEYLDSIFNEITTGVSLSVTAEENAKQNRESGFHSMARGENYKDLYRIRSRGLPSLGNFVDWYSSGKKVFPDDVNLSPTVLCHWFVCDGNYRKEQEYIRIECSNESNNKRKIEKYFEEGPSVEISNWEECGNRCSASFTQKDTLKLFNYMNKSKDETPIPGFSYKWV